MPISKRLRYEVLRRDDHTCRYCGARAPEVKLTVDHVVPVALGGDDAPDNLVAACAACNSGKSSVPVDAPIVAQVADDALRWSRAMELAAWRAEQNLRFDDEICAVFLRAWETWTFGGEPYPLHDDWRQSVRRFAAAGLSADLIARAADDALSTNKRVRDRFTYFCGICWTLIRQLQDDARNIIATEEET